MTTFKKKNEISLSDYGKLPPQAIELEEAVLGAIMLEKNALAEVIDILKPECFYKSENAKIFAVIKELFTASQPVDILTVTNKLRAKGEIDEIGGPYYVASLSNRVGSSANVEHHARIIVEKYIKRELIRISSEIIKDSYEDSLDTFDLLDKAESRLFEVAQGNIRKNYDRMSTLIQQALKQIEIAASQEGGLSGVRSGFIDLDRRTHGWQPSDLIILAARPGMGKTALSLALLRNAAVDHGCAAAIFSLEMSALQLVNRLIVAETGISNDKIKKGELSAQDWEMLNAKISKLSDAPIFIDDTPGLSVFELRAKARRLKAQHDIKIIFIDYLQLMTAGSDMKGNREQEISMISRSLKSIAKELEVPVIALSQLSRDVEKRAGEKKPQLSDLRESGAIEQDADMVLFIYRPDYYGNNQDEEGFDQHDRAEIIVAKHRHGQPGSVFLRWISHLAKFDNLDSGDMLGNSFSTPAFEVNRGAEFGPPRTFTLPSKMNDDFDDFVPPEATNMPF